MAKKAKKVLIIIDMQNDFITGSLANKDAEKIVDPICEFIDSQKWYHIILTRDTHQTNYLKTKEGINLPVEHCIKNTAGWCVNDKIQKALRNHEYQYLDKDTFGTLNWDFVDGWALKKADIYVCGTCTDICVISNVLIMKAVFPKANIKVVGNLCAGLAKEKHEAALEVMRSCQVEVIEYSNEEPNKYANH